MLTFDEFRECVALVGKLDPESIRPDSSFADDLDFDSLRMVELNAALADLGVVVPEELTLDDATVGEAYERSKGISGRLLP